MEIKDIEKLAKLSRLELTPLEKETFARDLENILEYVDQIREVVTDSSSLLEQGSGGQNEIAEISNVYNVLREDDSPNESGLYTDKILKEAPENQDGFIKVKKVL